MYDFEKVLAVFKEKKWFFSSVVETRLPEFDSVKIMYCLRLLRKSGFLKVRMGRNWNVSPPKYRGDPSGKTLQYQITEKGEDRIKTNVTVKADYGSCYLEDDTHNPRYDVKSWYFECEGDTQKLFEELTKEGTKLNSKIVREESFADQRTIFKIGRGSLAVIIPKKHISKLNLEEKDSLVFYYDENLNALLVRRRISVKIPI